MSTVIIQCLTFRQGLGPTDWKGSLQNPSSKEYRNRSQWWENTSIRAEESGCRSAHFLWIAWNEIKSLSLYMMLVFSVIIVGTQLRCGNPAVLKKSQIYPRGYGKAVCEYHRKFMESWLNFKAIEFDFGLVFHWEIRNSLFRLQWYRCFQTLGSYNLHCNAKQCFYG